MTPIILCHIPTDARFNSDVLIKNLTRHSPVSNMVFFGKGQEIPVIDPVVGGESKWFFQNAMFWTACRIAYSREADWMLYLECDCRVGCAGWDHVMLRELEMHLAKQPGIVSAGSRVVWNPCSGGPEGYRRWTMIMAEDPSPAYGNKGVADGTGSCVSVNGALGLYNIVELCKLFPEIQGSKTLHLSRTTQAYDKEIGTRIWKEHGAGAYDRVANMHSIFSVFGDVLTTENERLQMLKDAKVVAVHSVKSRSTV